MYPISVFAFLLAAVCGGGLGGWLLAVHGLRRAAGTFGLFLFVMGFWSLTHVGTVLTADPAWSLRFTQLSYLSVVSAPVVWLTFALRYTGRGGWVTRRRLTALSVVPGVTLAFVFTAEWHTLFYATIQPPAGTAVPLTEPGLWHVVNVHYSYTLLFIGAGLLAVAAVTDGRMRFRQSVVLLISLIVPWVVNAAFHLGYRPAAGVDPTPLAFVLVGIPLAMVVVQTDIRTVIPVAHRRVFRTATDPTVVFGPDDRVLDSNDAAEALLGDGGPIQDAAVEAILPDDLCVEGQPDPTLADAVEWTDTHGDEDRHYLVRRRAIDPDRRADARGYIVSFTDITLQRTQRDALAETNRTLSRQADALEFKNEQLERLASVVSHDLETPLSTAEGLIHLIRADIDGSDPEIERSLADLETVHGRLRTFAEALPDLAREGTDVESPVECDLERIARDAWSVVDTGPLTLVVESNGSFRGDPRRLVQAFENLFRNAVEHGVTAAGDETEATRVTVGMLSEADTASSSEADTASSSEAGVDRSVGFYIEDDGPGLPAHRRGAALEFGVGTGSGSGYGLAIVRTIVEAHGGTLSVTATEHGGARFEIRGLAPV